MVETERQMADRHVREQFGRIEKQEALVMRLHARGLSTIAALAILADMRELLSQMQAHVARFAN